MSGSEPDEMALEDSRVVVLPKFDMNIYTSKLTSSEPKADFNEYCISLDLHPRLSHSGMTMNRLPSRYIGLYIEQLEQGDLRVLFSSFFLVVIRHFGVHVLQLVSMGVNMGHWFSFENKTGRDTKKCFKEVTLSLKGWKKKFFLLDCHAISDAMPWRHGDTDLHDDFLTTYNGNDVARLSEFLVPLRPPPRHLLYMCGLTTACRHPDLQYNIKDQDKNVISMDTFLKLPTWTGIVVSKGDPVSEDQRPKPRVTPPLALGRRRISRTLLERKLNVLVLGLPGVQKTSGKSRNITSRLSPAQKGPCQLLLDPLQTTHTNKYVVPTGKDNFIVSAGRPNMVPAGRTIMSDHDDDASDINNDNAQPQQQQNIQPQIITTVLNNNAKFPYLKKDEYESIPDDHVADFHYMDDARDIWNSVKARFGGNVKSKKIRKSMLKQEFSDFRISESKGLHKGYDRMQKILSGLGLLSFDDLYYKLKTLEIDIKGYSTHSSSQSPSHYAFVSTTSASKKMSYAEIPSFSSSTNYSAPSSSKARSHSFGNVLQDVLHSLVAESEPKQQVAYEDFEQIDKLDLEEMDIKWQMTMLSVRVNKFEKKARRKIEFDKKEADRFNKKEADRTWEKDGVAERKNRTIIEAARTMLADSKLPTMFWTEAVRTACYVLNRVLVTSPHNKTPYALLTRNIPSVSHFKPFGCHVTILNTSDHLGKFDGKADEGYIVGYSTSNRAYKVYNVPNKRVEETLNLRYLKEKPNVQGLGHEWYFNLDYLTDTLGYKRDKAKQSAGTQEASTNPVGTQDADSDSECDEQVIIVPSYPSHNIQEVEPKDTSGDEIDDSPLDSAERSGTKSHL
ncbi:putative ribonuclease H-like domain-containing protein [Tanacetum coccineum]